MFQFRDWIRIDPGLIRIMLAEGGGVVARPFRPAGGRYPASVVLAELARLWDRAADRMAGRGEELTQRRLAEASGVPSQTLNSWATGTSLPQHLDQLHNVGRALAGWAGEEPPKARQWDQWRRRDQFTRAPDPGDDDDTQPGRLVTELTDPFVLEVHRPVAVDSAGADLPVLPPYIRRRHDEELAQVVARAAGGHSAMAVLVGGSSTGKTRACWEAIHRLPPGWRLWHPFDPTRPEAVLAELPRVGLRTVVWLNETQLYLDTPSDTGERVAAALRTLLTDPRRAPVLVLGTLWPSHWDTLTREGDRHAQARTVLAGTDIPVPPAFTGPALKDLQRAAAADVRLAAAAAAAQDGHVTQYLAGVPELLARYRHAPPAAKALIHAAMDARRLGHRTALPHALLAAAAPAYLTDTEWDALGEDWLEQALAYTAEPCKGVSGPLTRIRPRPSRPGSRHGKDQPAGGPVYRLADYLDQHGRHHRKSQFPPAGFWAAAADHALRDDQATLGDAAHARGLYRDAAQLHKNAAARGNRHAIFYLSEAPHYLRSDVRTVRWAVAHAPLDDPQTVNWLLGSLRAAGAQEQVTALADRAAAHVALDNPDAVAWLLGALRAAGAQEQVTALADRAATHTPLDRPDDVARLLDSLRAAGAQEQVTALADRAAAHVALDDPDAVAFLLGALRTAGAQEQVTALADRAAAHVALDNPAGVARLLDSLRAAGAQEQVTALADRAAAHVSLDNPGAVAFLLDRLRWAGAQEQAAALLHRDPAAHVSLDYTAGVAELLGGLRAAGAQEQAAALLHRDPAAQVSLDDPDAVARLLGRLRAAGAQEQVTALADRAAAHVSLDNPGAVAFLLGGLRWAGAQEQAAALLHRDPVAEVSLDDPGAVASLLGRLRAACAQEQVTALLHRDPAAQVSLDDPDAVASLLGALRAACAQEQAAALLHRDPAAQVSLDNPAGVASLLGALRWAGAQEQITALADRAAAHVSLDKPGAVAFLLDRLRWVGAQEQAAALADRAAAHVSLDDPDAVAFLLDRLRTAGAQEQAAALADRAAAHVSLDDPDAVAFLLDRLRTAGAQEQVTALADRAAAHVSLDNPGAVAFLLDRLRWAGAQEQAAALLHRDPAAQVSLDDPDAVASLLDSLRAAGAQEQVTALADRLPAEGRFDLFQSVAGRRSRFGREPDGRPTKPWGWADLD